MKRLNGFLWLVVLAAPRLAFADFRLAHCGTIVDDNVMRPFYQGAKDTISHAALYMGDVVGTTDAGAPSASIGVYETWFGKWEAIDDTPTVGTNAPVRLTVRNRIGNIKTYASSAQLTISCEDVKPACYFQDGPDQGKVKNFAYTLKETFPDTIFLCPLAWEVLPEHGFESRRSVISHELVHLSNQPIFDTGDKKPTEERQKDLARTNPITAAATVSNYHGFFEDAEGVIAGCGCSTSRRSGGLGGVLVIAALLAAVTRRRLTMNGRRLVALAGLVGCALLASACIQRARAVGAPRAPGPDPRVACEANGPSAIKMGDPLRVSWTLRNVTSEPLRAWREGTPLASTPNSNDISVRCNGVPALYVGVEAYPAFGRSPGAYVDLPPGVDVKGGRTITDDYRLTPGVCVIEWKVVPDVLEGGPGRVRPKREREEPSILACPPVSVVVEP